MSENSTRTRAEIDAEYTQLATKAGDCEYKVKHLQAQLKLIYEKMNKLNQEAATLLEKEPDPSPEAA